MNTTTSFIGKYEKIVSELLNQRGKIDRFESKYTRIKSKRDDTIEKLYDMRFSYDLDTVTKPLGLRDNLLNTIKNCTTKVHIYHRMDTNPISFIIKYDYGLWNYKFTVDSNYRLNIEKDGEKLFEYDLVKECRPLNFNHINRPHVIENYINLFIKNNNIKLGMILMAYYYIIDNILYKSKGDDKTGLLDSVEIQELCNIFNSNNI